MLAKYSAALFSITRSTSATSSVEMRRSGRCAPRESPGRAREDLVPPMQKFLRVVASAESLPQVTNGGSECALVELTL